MVESCSINFIFQQRFWLNLSNSPELREIEDFGSEIRTPALQVKDVGRHIVIENRGPGFPPFPPRESVLLKNLHDLMTRVK